MTKITPAELERNLRALNHAIAQQRLEGLEVTPEMKEDLAKIVIGEMTPDEAIRRAKARYQKTPT